MPRAVNWRLHSDVSGFDTPSTSLGTTGHAHVSHFDVGTIYLNICEHSAYIVALVDCSLSQVFSSHLLDVTGEREDWVHGHLI